MQIKFCAETSVRNFLHELSTHLACSGQQITVQS